mgnify:CR=1 FL=1
MNVATAEAMQGPPEKHLARRQQYFTFILKDILYHTYNRAAELRSLPALPTDNYEKLFKVTAPDVSSRDNNMLATAATSIAGALQSLQTLLQSNNCVLHHSPIPQNRDRIVARKLMGIN